MIICICEAVSDRTIRREIREGADSVRAIRRACGAGRRCGSCVCDLREMIDHGRAENPSSAPVDVAMAS